MEKWEGMSVGEITRTALREIRDAIFDLISFDYIWLVLLWSH